jgi:hypothetical protein
MIFFYMIALLRLEGREERANYVQHLRNGQGDLPYVGLSNHEITLVRERFFGSDWTRRDELEQRMRIDTEGILYILSAPRPIRRLTFHYSNIVAATTKNRFTASRRGRRRRRYTRIIDFPVRYAEGFNDDEDPNIDGNYLPGHWDNFLV